MTDDPFFQRLRNDARTLRHEPDDVALSRMHAQIQSRIENTPATVAQLLAAWFRPLAASALALTLIAAIGLAATSTDDISLGDEALEISMAGETWRVGD